MEKNETGNTSINEVPQSSTDNDSAKFFGSLDQSLNGGILDNNETSEVTSVIEGNNNPLQSPNNGVQQENVETLKKRYSDSSKEGKRLNERLTELEPYVPILDAMRDDPNLIQHVRGYFEGGGQAPTSMKERLKLDEDFIFDPDDAIANPNSESAQVLNATIDGVVQKRLSQAARVQQAENQQLNEAAMMKEKHSMNEEEWNEYISFAKDHKLTHDDIYYLKNREGRDRKIAENASQDVMKQMKNTQGRPSSLAATGSAKVETNQENQLFDAILGIDKQLDNAFG